MLHGLLSGIKLISLFFPLGKSSTYELYRRHFLHRSISKRSIEKANPSLKRWWWWVFDIFGQLVDHHISLPYTYRKHYIYRNIWAMSKYKGTILERIFVRQCIFGTWICQKPSEIIKTVMASQCNTSPFFKNLHLVKISSTFLLRKINPTSPSWSPH